MIIGLMGYIGSGKNTASDFLIKYHGFQQDSFASSLKDACSVIFGWPRDLLEGVSEESRVFRETPDEWWSAKLGKTFTPRYALQNLGTEILRHQFHPDIWLLSLEKKLQNTTKDVVITDTRFPNEVDLIRKLGGKIILVQSSNLPYWSPIAKKASLGDRQSINQLSSLNIHESEWAWASIEPDFVIKNIGTIDDLKEEVKKATTIFN